MHIEIVVRSLSVSLALYLDLYLFIYLCLSPCFFLNLKRIWPLHSPRCGTCPALEKDAFQAVWSHIFYGRRSIKCIQRPTMCRKSPWQPENSIRHPSIGSSTPWCCEAKERGFCQPGTGGEGSREGAGAACGPRTLYAHHGSLHCQR